MTSTETPVLLERDYPSEHRDPHVVSENISRGRQYVHRWVPARYADAELDNPMAQEWLQSLLIRTMGNPNHVPVVRHGPSLLILGATGTGKTHLAYAAVTALSLSGVSCPWTFATATDIYADLRPSARSDTERAYRRYADASVLVIDDLGIAKHSEFTEEINNRLINYRYVHELPTLITSNVAPKDLRDELGERVASRLAEMTQRVVLAGDDRRKAA